MSQWSLASNPGPHHHRICDRREEGLVKPPFCFGSLPTIVGKISHSNYLPKSAVFKSYFDSQKHRDVARRRLSLSRYKHKANPSLGLVDASTWSKRRRGKDEDFLVQKSLTLWPLKFIVCSERNVFPYSFSCFLFFFAARLPVGENTSLLPCGSNTSSAQGASGKRGPDLLALFERRDASPNNASAPKGMPCRRCAMPKACSVCHHGNKVEQTQQLQTKLSLQDVGLVVFKFNLARQSLFFVKHDKCTDKATNHNDCTKNF